MPASKDRSLGFHPARPRPPGGRERSFTAAPPWRKTAPAGAAAAGSNRGQSRVRTRSIRTRRRLAGLCVRPARQPIPPGHPARLETPAPRSTATDDHHQTPPPPPHHATIHHPAQQEAPPSTPAPPRASSSRRASARPALDRHTQPATRSLRHGPPGPTSPVRRRHHSATNHISHRYFL